jgi:hypothetical protein
MHVGVQNYMKYQCTTHTIYLPWYSGTYNFQGVEHLQMRPINAGEDEHGGSSSRPRTSSALSSSASGLFRMCRSEPQMRHNLNVCTDVPCSGQEETRCELYPCVNAMYPHKTEVRQVMRLQDTAKKGREGVFAREDIEVGTFLLDFGELRRATALESGAQWCGWKLRFAIESKLSTVTKTFVVKDADSDSVSDGGGGGAGMVRGGKVNSTCCRAHKNAELVPDSARMRMYVRTTRQVRVDSEILVMYSMTEAFSGECREGAGVVGARSALQRVARRALACFIGGHTEWGASGIPVFEGTNKPALIRNVQHACCSLKHVCYMTKHVPCMFTSQQT